MMFVDASALVAVICAESGYVPLADRLRMSKRSMTSAFAVFETVMAVCRKNGFPVDRGEAAVRRFLEASSIVIVPISVDELSFAFDAHTRFGKGRGHPAQLNMGDCFAYACARSHKVPLLFVGNDFSQTDIRSAMD